MWTDKLHNQFTIEGIPVDVITYAHQQRDIIAVKIVSPLLTTQQLAIRLHFPYPNGDFKDVGLFDGDSSRHRSELTQYFSQSATIRRILDTTTYFVQMKFVQGALVKKRRAHDFIVRPVGTANTFEASFCFA